MSVRVCELSVRSVVSSIGTITHDCRPVTVTGLRAPGPGCQWRSMASGCHPTPPPCHRRRRRRCLRPVRCGAALVLAVVSAEV